MSASWVKACGKFPSASPLGAGFLRVEAKVIGVAEHPLEEQAGFVEPRAVHTSGALGCALVCQNSAHLRGLL